MDSAREKALNETRRTRENAERLLASLLEAQASCEAQLAAEKRADLVKHVTGKTSLEQGIEETRRMIDILKRAEEEAARDHGSPETTGHDASGNTPNAFTEPLQTPAFAERLHTVTEAKPSPPQPRLVDDSDVEEELTRVAGVLRANPAATRTNVFFSSRTTTRLGALR